MSIKIKVVLVEPLYEGNVGSVARAMKNFGLKDLVLVNPCKLEGAAKAMASHAKDILNNATIYETLNDALSDDSSIVVATTGIKTAKKDEHLRFPALSPKELKYKINGFCKNSSQITLMFGRENIGFTNDELKLCDLLVTIPTSQEYPIMNLSHAASILFYELSDTDIGNFVPADKFDKDLLIDHIVMLLTSINYPEHKFDKTCLMIRRIIGRANLTSREVQTLRGIIRNIQRKMRLL